MKYVWQARVLEWPWLWFKLDLIQRLLKSVWESPHLHQCTSDEPIGISAWQLQVCGQPIARRKRLSSTEFNYCPSRKREKKQREKERECVQGEGEGTEIKASSSYFYYQRYDRAKSHLVHWWLLIVQLDSRNGAWYFPAPLVPFAWPQVHTWAAAPIMLMTLLPDALSCCTNWMNDQRFDLGALVV